MNSSPICVLLLVTLVKPLAFADLSASFWRSPLRRSELLLEATQGSSTPLQ
jgi:hypothetical protein